MFSLIKCLKSKKFNPVNIRTFFSPQYLGIESFLYTREQASKNYTNADIVLENLKKNIDESKQLFTEDIKKLSYLINKKEDGKYFLKALENYYSDNEEFRFTSFKLGPIVTRALFAIKDLETLMELYEDEKTKKVFEQFTSKLIYADMLYEAGKYEKIIDLLEDSNKDATDNLSNLLVIATAAAFKIETEDALKRITKFLKSSDRNSLKKKTILLYAALALKLNKPNLAYETLVISKQCNLSRNLSVKTLAKLHKFDDVLGMLKFLNNGKSIYGQNKTIFKEVIDCIKEELDKEDHEELRNYLNEINVSNLENVSLENEILEKGHLLSNNQNKFFNQNQNNRFRNDFRFNRRNFQNNRNDFKKFRNYDNTDFRDNKTNRKEFKNFESKNIPALFTQI